MDTYKRIEPKAAQLRDQAAAAQPAIKESQALQDLQHEVAREELQQAAKAERRAIPKAGSTPTAISLGC
jgi:hypothetical protein